MRLLMLFGKGHLVGVFQLAAEGNAPGDGGYLQRSGKGGLQGQPVSC